MTKKEFNKQSFEKDIKEYAEEYDGMFPNKKTGSPPKQQPANNSNGTKPVSLADDADAAWRDYCQQHGHWED